MDMKKKNIVVFIIFIVVGMLLVSYNPSFIIRADPEPPPPPPPPTSTPPPTTPRQTHTHSTKTLHYEMEAFCKEDYYTISIDEIATYIITLRNRGDEDTATISYKRPPGWYGSISDKKVTLKKNETKDITIEIYPSASCKCGVYETHVKIKSQGEEIDLTLETEVFFLGDISIKNFNYTVENGNVDFYLLLNNTGNKKDVEVIFCVDGTEKERQKLSIEGLKEAVFSWSLESGEHKISFECVSDDENQKNNKLTKTINFGEYGVSKSQPEMYMESATTLMGEGKYFEAYYYYCSLDDEEGKNRCEKYIIADIYEQDGERLLKNGKYTEAYSFLSEALNYYKNLGDSKKVSEIEEVLKSFSDKLHPGASLPETVIVTEENTTMVTSLVAGLALLLLVNIILILELSKKKRTKGTEEKYKRIKRKYGI
jgi:tetratricopeptide (TPR) repeat protein